MDLLQNLSGPAYATPMEGLQLFSRGNLSHPTGTQPTYASSQNRQRSFRRRPLPTTLPPKHGSEDHHQRSTPPDRKGHTKPIPADPWTMLLSKPTDSLIRSENKLTTRITLATQRD
ncbi:Hypothetical predicted protein [Pelobates cultripes]|uniref:Uncharacterized protein n=1 Tax=Pelobates cultripes TaxID=61616 RepID=A0AAD1VX32_PELCU|nr:Hypothetical predicted protein [Pelobates cultripes]